MYLKLRYPLEFYWALLRCEPDRIKIQRFAKDAKKHGVELLPPSVSVSGEHFKIDRKANAIRGSLVDIKGVGDAASRAIQKAQPFADLYDFFERVERRKVHKGVISALVKAGALDEFLPNVKWFLDNLEKIWKVLDKVGPRSPDLRRLIDASAAKPDYAAEERMLLASSVSPLAFGKHPIDAYSEFIARKVLPPIVSMSDDDFFKTYGGRSVFVAGVIVEVKYNQVGDFHTGALPSEDERAKMGWGKRYANINVEDAGGKQNRIKVDTDIFDDFREVVDSGIGTPVVLSAAVNGHFENLRANFLVDLEAYRKKVEAGAELTLWERILAGEHPARAFPWKTEAKAADRLYNARFYKHELPPEQQTNIFTGVVTNVKTKIDKRGSEMAFFGLIDAAFRSVEVVCFGSFWPFARKSVQAGTLVKVMLEIGDRRGGTYILCDRMIPKPLRPPADSARPTTPEKLPTDP